MMTATAPATRGDLMDISIFSEDREMPVFDGLRAHNPVHWNPPSPLGPGFWALTRYADVKAAAADNVRLSSAHGTQIVERKVEGKLASLHNMDDPEHAKLRKIAIPHLRALKVKQWQDMIDEAVTYLLDDVQGRTGEFDMVHTVSARLPMLVLSRILGVPAPDAPKMVDWTNRLTSSDPADTVDEAALAEARGEVMAYFEKLTELRRREPTHDLISVLANSEKDGRPLTWEELAAYYILLVAAGNETARHAVSGGTILLDRDQASWRRLVDDQTLIVPAVEEILRWVSPVAAMRRTALEPLRIGDKDIAAGDKVVLWFSAANRDPEVFEQPHEFCIDRTRNEHLTFGWGIHFCLGAHLARAEVRSFFTEVLRRGLRFEVTGDPVRVYHNIFRGWTRLPVRVATAPPAQPMPAAAPEPAAVTFPSNAVYLAGEWVPPAGLDQLPVLNPATEEVIGSIVDASAAEVRAAFAAARTALPGWSGTAPAERADILDRLADAFRTHGEELAVLASREVGMPIKESRAVQADLPERVLRSTAGIARSFPWQARDASGTTIVREPVGVVLGITPWNFPVHQLVAKLAPALAAGCTVVLKPAELTPLNGLFVAALCDRIGVPPGVVNVLTGRGSTTGETLVQSGEYDLVSFTGSLAVGRHIGAVAGERVVRATLELGGKSPAVVLDDADLDVAVRATVRNCFINAGQKCNAPTRLIVPEARRSEAVSIAVAAAEAYVLGDPLDERSTMGPLASDTQRAKVLGYVEGARARGARVAGGGPADGFDRGYFVRPAIITDVSADDPVVQEEIFGPVLVVLGHEGYEDAVRLANDSPYGLSAEVWSGDPARAAALARRIRAGQVRVNGVRTPELPVSPFGGYKASGLGRELGAFGLEEYLEVKAVLGDPESS